MRACLALPAVDLQRSCHAMNCRVHFGEPENEFD
jgi:hypothetical protein